MGNLSFINKGHIKLSLIHAISLGINMIANYANNPKLFEQCIHLIDEVFPGCKECALNSEKYQASWREASTPFIVEKDGEVIAHAGVWPITLMLNGKKHRTASIHGVCVKPEHRGKGYFKQLMQKAIQYAEAHFESSLFFTTKPYLYKNYPYKMMLPEYDFIVSEKLKLSSTGSGTDHNSELRVLNLDNTDDLTLMHRLLSTRLPLSNQISIMEKNGNALFILNTLKKQLHYSEKLNAIILFEILNGTLYLKEVISDAQCSLTDVIASIPGQFNKVVLQFCPDRFLDEKEYAPVLAGPECCIMTSNSFLFDSQYFRYPEVYGC